MRFNNIQVLRVLAAAGVVVYHLGCHGPALIGVGSSWLKFPILSSFPVPLFFAVSGFVLAHAVQSAKPGRFLLARFLRLYPGYWLAMAGALAMMCGHLYTEQHVHLFEFTRASTVALWPAGDGKVIYYLGIEWSLVYEVFLSLAVAFLSLFGARRGLPLLAGLWLAAIMVKAVIAPGSYTEIFPHWSTIALSAINVPFLLGILMYFLRNASSRWGAIIGTAVASCLWLGSTVAFTLEQVWLCWGLAGAGTVWLAVRAPQLAAGNPIVRLGDCTYGLFLFHVPLMLAVLYSAESLGGHGRIEVLWLAFAVALFGGLLFGRLESALHTRLRTLTKMPLPPWIGLASRALRPWRPVIRMRRTSPPRE